MHVHHFPWRKPFPVSAFFFHLVSSNSTTNPMHGCSCHPTKNGSNLRPKFYGSRGWNKTSYRSTNRWQIEPLNRFSWWNFQQELMQMQDFRQWRDSEYIKVLLNRRCASIWTKASLTETAVVVLPTCHATVNPSKHELRMPRESKSRA